MKKSMSPRKWIVLVISFVLIALLIMSMLMYVVDPFFQFRVRDNTYMLNPQYVNGGLIKNYEYDTLMIGSSMTQNFDMDIMRKELNVSPLHVSLGGMSALEMIELLNLANQVGKANTYYIGIDLWIMMQEADPSNNVSYLITQEKSALPQYFVSHEAWFYSLPISTAMLMVKQLGINLPSSVDEKASIDNLGNWESKYTCSEDIVLDHYINGNFAVSEINLTHAYEIAKNNIDDLFLTLENYPGDVIFFFPPYSGLFWHSKESSVDTILAVKEYFVEKAYACGYTTFDFQGQDFIADLNLYRDTSHYGGDINDWMVYRFADGECIVTPNTLDSFNEDLKRSIAITVDKYGPRLNGN